MILMQLIKYQLKILMVQMVSQHLVLKKIGDGVIIHLKQ